MAASAQFSCPPPRWNCWPLTEVAIDPFTTYAKAIRHLVLHARLVVDKFHVLRLFARAVDQVRRRTIRQDRRGRKIELMWRTRMLLMKRYSRLTVEQEERILTTLGAEDFWGEVTGARAGNAR